MDRDDEKSEAVEEETLQRRVAPYPSRNRGELHKLHGREWAGGGRRRRGRAEGGAGALKGSLSSSNKIID